MRHSRTLSGLTILGLIVGTVFVLGAALWTVTNMAYSRKLERELASLRADGYPLTLAEIKPKPVPEAMNAANVYMPLFDVNFDPLKGSPGNAPESGLRRFKVDKTDLPDVLAAQSIIESPEAQTALATLKHASSMPFCVFPLRWDDTYNALFPHLAQFRQATRMVCAQAVLLSHQGRRADALDWLGVGLRMADQVAQEPTLIAQLVAIAMRAITEKAARDIITEADLSPTLARPLYDQLGQTDHVQTYKRSMEMELAMGLTMMEQLGRKPGDFEAIFGEAGSFYPAPVEKLMATGPGRTWLKLEQANYAHYMHESLQSVDKPYRETARAKPAPIPPRFGTVLSSMLIPVFSRVNMKRDQSIATTRLLQIVLALKAQKHSLGSYPDALSGLVWLPPTQDPFSGKPFTYRRQSSGFLLYGIGPNLQDDGGRPPSKPGKIGEEGDMVWRCAR